MSAKSDDMVSSIGLSLSKIFIFLLLFFVKKTFGVNLFMNNYCGSTIELGTGVAGNGGFFLSSQSSPYYSNSYSCEFTVVASDRDKRILLNFYFFDVEKQDRSSCYDRLHIYSGPDEIRLTNSQGLCGVTIPSDYVANERVKLTFVTDSSVSKQGFRIVLCEFYEADDNSDDECLNDDYYCLDTNRCIDKDLDRNTYDYCGDESYIDENTVSSSSQLDTAIIFGITIGIVAGIIFVGGLCYGIIAKWKESRPKRISPAERLQMQQLQQQDQLRRQIRPPENPFWRHPTPPPAYGSERYGWTDSNSSHPGVGTVSAMVHQSELPPSYEDATRSNENQNITTTTSSANSDPSRSINNPLLPGEVAPDHPRQVTNRQNSRSAHT